MNWLEGNRRNLEMKEMSSSVDESTALKFILVKAICLCYCLILRNSLIKLEYDLLSTQLISIFLFL